MRIKSLAFVMAVLMAGGSAMVNGQAGIQVLPDVAQAGSAPRPLEPAVVRASVDRFSREVPWSNDRAIQQTSPPRRSKTERALIVAVSTVLGFFGGAYAGYGIDSAVAPCRCESCDCDMVGFRGAMIGAPLGATVGFVASLAATR